jgi:TetR/AcrR family transcriptional repressor of nem operon
MARPREFEPEDALEKAMRQFWTRGYFDTSIRDLIECTGVNYYGLYGTFSSKHGLFLAALDHYQKTVTARVLEQLRRPGLVRETLQKTLQQVLDLMQTPEGRVGCLMCNTAVEVAPHDHESADKVRKHMGLLREAFLQRLADAQSSGELPIGHDLDALSEFLTTTVYSIGFLVRSGQDDAYVQRHIRTCLSAVG